MHQPVRLFSNSSSSSSSDSDSDFEAEFKETKPQRNNNNRGDSQRQGNRPPRQFKTPITESIEVIKGLQTYVDTQMDTVSNQDLTNFVR